MPWWRSSLPLRPGALRQVLRLPAADRAHFSLVPPCCWVGSRAQVNELCLKRAWESSQRSTKEDWEEWMRNLSVELLKESPSPALRACHQLAQLQPHVARELFAAGFVRCTAPPSVPGGWGRVCCWVKESEGRLGRNAWPGGSLAERRRMLTGRVGEAAVHGLSGKSESQKSPRVGVGVRGVGIAPSIALPAFERSKCSTRVFEQLL